MIDRPLLSGATFLLLSLAASGLAQAESLPVGGAQLCLDAARHAARQTGVPVQVLYAVTLTETGRTVRGDFQPWPWALNQAGDSQWFDTADDAMAALENGLQDGRTNIDVGCFQINYRWHSAQFPSLDQMMNPTENALYAARLLAGHFAKTGDWTAAVGRYHSTTEEAAEVYLARFTPIYQGVSPAPVDPDLATRTVADNGFPFLKGGLRGSGASIVPLVGASRRLIGHP